MLGIAIVLVTVTLSMMITRVAVLILTATGMQRGIAKFQARSALTGAGFTTNESENIVNHPVRRKVVAQLMLIGNAGFVVAAAGLIRGFTVTGGGFLGAGGKLLLLAAGLYVLVWGSGRPWIDRRLTGVVARIAARVTELEVRDYAGMLRLHGDYAVAEINVNDGDWLVGRTLSETQIGREGVLVLGLARRDGGYLGAPTGSTLLSAGDILNVYGRVPALQELDERRRGSQGDRAHEEAVAAQAQIIEDEARGADDSAGSDGDGDDRDERAPHHAEEVDAEELLRQSGQHESADAPDDQRATG